MKNPLLAYPLDWRQLTAARLPQLINEGLRLAQVRLKKLEALPLKEASYKTVIDAMDVLSRELDLTWGVAHHLASVADTPAIRKVLKKYMPLVSGFYAGIGVNAQLWARVKLAAKKTRGLTDLQKRHLMWTVKGFRRSGADLAPAAKRRYVKIVQALSKLNDEFGKKVLDGENAFEKHFADGAENNALKGLPPSALAMGRTSAHAKGKKGYLFTLQRPSLSAITTYADDAQLRKEFTLANQSVGFRAPNDTLPIIKKILTLRQEKARMLGYKGFAEYVTEFRMLNSPQKVESFLDQLTRACMGPARADVMKVAAHKRQLGDKTPLEPWDMGYYGEKLKKKTLDLQTEELRPYFEFTRVRQSLFDLVQRLYGIRFKQVKNHKAWHSDVEYFEIWDNKTKKMRGAFYTDFFSRADKRSGAWHNGLAGWSPQVPGSREVAVVCGDFTPPTTTQPSLMSHYEATVLFHEFGHLMHNMLSDVEIPALAGTNVAWDFVELPSTIMENYCYDPKFLRQMARHYQTGKPLPAKKIESLRKLRNFMFASTASWIVGHAMVDLKVHQLPRVPADLDAVVAKVWGKYRLPMHTQRASRFRKFGHIFDGGYAVGYYSYLWSEVMECDVWQYFKRHGIMNPQVGERFRRTILSQGDRHNPAKLFKDMMGRSPRMTAYLKRLK